MSLLYGFVELCAMIGMVTCMAGLAIGVAVLGLSFVAELVVFLGFITNSKDVGTQCSWFTSLYEKHTRTDNDHHD